MNKSAAIEIRIKKIADKRADLKLIKENISITKIAKISFKITLFTKFFKKIGMKYLTKFYRYAILLNYAEDGINRPRAIGLNPRLIPVEYLSG